MKALLKTITYRLLGTLLTLLISLALTNDLPVSSTIAVCEIMGKSLLYYFHEKLWEAV